MTKKYILTGGPGTGKSSLILALEQAGYATIREAAEDYIRFRQAMGQPEPWTEEDFQALLRDLQPHGYGWLREAGVRAKLEEMTANWQGPPPLFG